MATESDPIAKRQAVVDRLNPDKTPYGICQEQIEAFGLAQLQEESKT